MASYNVSDDDLSSNQIPSVVAYANAPKSNPSKSYNVSDDDLSGSTNSSLSNTASSIASSIGSSAGAFAAAIPKGIGQLGANANQELTQGVNSLFGTHLISPPNPFNYSPDSTLGQLETNNPWSTALGNFAGRAAPQLLTLPETMGGSLASNAAFGTLNDPNHPVLGGLIGTGFGAVAGGLGAGSNYAANSIASGLNTEVNQAADRLGISNLGLGERTQNPLLKDTSQNRLPGIPFSGAAQNYADIGSQLDNKAEDAINSIKPNISLSSIPEKIQDALQSGYDDAQNLKRNLYNQVDVRANQNKTVVGNNYYLNGYTDPSTGIHTDGINDLLSKSSGSTPELRLTPSTRSFLQNISDYNKLPDYQESSIILPQSVREQLKSDFESNAQDMVNQPFGQASLVRGKLNNLSNDMSQSSDPFQRREGALFQGLRQLKLMDMNDAASNSNDPELINMYQNAQNNYSNNIAPYDDPVIKKYLNNGSKSDNPDSIISSFLKTGQNNQPTLLNNLLSKLPNSQKNSVGYYFMTRSLPRDDLGNPILNRTNLTRFNNSLQNYDPSIRNQLIPPEVQQTLKDVGTVGSQIPDLLLNPPTGARLNNAATATAILGPAAFMAGHGNYLGAAAYPGAAIGGARGLNNILTSPSFRNRILSRNLNFIPKTNLIAALGNTGANSLINNF